MNRRNISVLILFFFSALLNAQKIEGKITYLASSNKALIYNKEKKSKKKNKEIKLEVNKLYKNAKDVKVVLKFNNLRSEYFVSEKMNFTNKEDFNYTKILAGSSKKYYIKNEITGYKSTTLDCYLLGECFLIENLLPKWELTQDTKVIGGFICYKAILKNPRTGIKNFEAWYAPKIPYGYGVMNYYGLPGLILEINRNTFTITAIKIELNPAEKIIVNEPKKVKKITQKEFKLLTRKALPGFYKQN